jgi:hypothetical protein
MNRIETMLAGSLFGVRQLDAAFFLWTVAVEKKAVSSHRTPKTEIP